MDEKEIYLKYLLDRRVDIHSIKVSKELNRLGILLSEHPYKLYGVTYDGNRNEVCIFLDAFSTYEEAELESITDSQFHDRYVDLEEDY